MNKTSEKYRYLPVIDKTQVIARGSRSEVSGPELSLRMIALLRVVGMLSSGEKRIGGQSVGRWLPPHA